MRFDERISVVWRAQRLGGKPVTPSGVRMSAPAMKSQWPSALKQLRNICVSSWLGPSSGNSVVAALLAAEAIGLGRNVNMPPTTANPAISRIIGAPLPDSLRDYSS